ncbi:hypothetical protein RB2083_2248 [Rhodobacteraceae bacterium HTCC2083]|nr:hypothetical protein RB2083_2248 [Rhodobacteraceae bacterium HTCC2083]
MPQIRPKDKGKGGEIQTLLKVFLLGSGPINCLDAGLSS